jgi:uncharacterized protein (TIGR00369 family)
MKKQANSNHCFICGVENPSGLQMKFYNTAPGEVYSKYTVPERYESYPGTVHGGIIAAMLDEVAGRAFTSGDSPNFLVTVQLTVRYRKPVPSCQPIILKGHALSNTGRARKAGAEIFDEAGQLLCEADAILTDIPSDLTHKFDSAGSFWKIIPDEENLS